MQTLDDRTWHSKIYALSYTMFGALPQSAPDRWTYWCTVAGTSGYCLLAGAIFVALNIATLPFGIYAEPAWRAKSRFSPLHFPGPFPIPFIAAPLWLAYGTYCAWVARGAIFALGPWLFVPGLGLLLLGGTMFYNRLRKGRGTPRK
jgi:hypothetical protein